MQTDVVCTNPWGTGTSQNVAIGHCEVAAPGVRWPEVTSRLWFSNEDLLFWIHTLFTFPWIQNYISNHVYILRYYTLVYVFQLYHSDFKEIRNSDSLKYFLGIVKLKIRSCFCCAERVSESGIQNHKRTLDWAMEIPGRLHPKQSLWKHMHRHAHEF